MVPLEIWESDCWGAEPVSVASVYFRSAGKRFVLFYPRSGFVSYIRPFLFNSFRVTSVYKHLWPKLPTFSFFSEEKQNPICCNALGENSIMTQKYHYISSIAFQLEKYIEMWFFLDHISEPYNTYHSILQSCQFASYRVNHWTGSRLKAHQRECRLAFIHIWIHNILI